MTNEVYKTGIYQHYKGDYYEVIGVARDTETLEETVVYRALYGEGHLWVRAKEMFFEEILVGQNRIPRFKFISKQDAKSFLENQSNAV